MTNKLVPARGFPPGRRLQDELDARGWTQQDLAKIIDRPPQAISEIVTGKKQITPETALELAEAFGTSAEVWLKLEANYQLSLARQKPRSNTIAKRSQLFDLMPVRELTRLGWLKATSDVDELEGELCDFLEIRSISERPALAARFRETHVETHTPEAKAQIAWAMRVRKLARRQSVGTFYPDRLANVIDSLLSLTREPDGVRGVPVVLKDAGIRFVIVPHLTKTYLDGAAFYLAEGEPVIALTLRYDRLDNFWFVLMHEVAHLYKRHPGVFIDRVEGRDTDDEHETAANAFSRNWLIDESAYRLFVRESFLGFDDDGIRRFSAKVKRHPGIVVGRLQKDELLHYSQGRHFLEKVKWRFTEVIDRA